MKNLIRNYNFTISLIILTFTFTVLAACSTQSTTQDKPDQNKVTESFTINSIKYNDKLPMSITQLQTRKKAAYSLLIMK
jgi:hypothetical protein